MAEFVLKDQYGKEKTFDHDKIFVQGTDGELIQFTEGNGEAVVQPLEVTENGTYTAPDGVDGFNQVTVNVDTTWAVILPKEEVNGFVLDSTFGAFSPGYVYPANFTLETEKTYKVSWDGVDYECVAFAITLDPNQQIFGIGNASSLGLQGNNEPFLIIYNQTYDNTQLFSTDTNESHAVGIWKKAVQEIKLQDKTITENGTYTADSGYDGLGGVTVEVAGSGVGLPEGVYLSFGQYRRPNSYSQKWFYYNDQLYAMARDKTGAGDTYNLYKYSNGTWATVISSGSISGFAGPDSWSFVEFNGKIHMIGGELTHHRVFDGTSFSQLSSLPAGISCGATFVHENKLKAYGYYTGAVYVWDESKDTWETEGTIGSKYNYYYFVTVGETAYCAKFKNLYKYENGAITQIATLSINGSQDIFAYGSCLYYNSSGFPGELYKYDTVTGKEHLVGYLPSSGISLFLNNELYFIFGSSGSVSIGKVHEVTE